MSSFVTVRFYLAFYRIFDKILLSFGENYHNAAREHSSKEVLHARQEEERRQTYSKEISDKKTNRKNRKKEHRFRQKNRKEKSGKKKEYGKTRPNGYTVSS